MLPELSWAVSMSWAAVISTCDRYCSNEIWWMQTRCHFNEWTWGRAHAINTDAIWCTEIRYRHKCEPNNKNSSIISKIITIPAAKSIHRRAYELTFGRIIIFFFFPDRLAATISHFSPSQLLLVSLRHFALFLHSAQFFFFFSALFWFTPSNDRTVFEARLHFLLHRFQFSLVIMWSAIKLYLIFVVCASKK